MGSCIFYIEIELLKSEQTLSDYVSHYIILVQLSYIPTIIVYIGSNLGVDARSATPLTQIYTVMPQINGS